MWEPPFFGGFQGLWEGWDGFIVPRFPLDRHFHRGARTRFLDEVWAVDRPRVPLVASLLAVGHHLGRELKVLLRFHQGKCVTEAFVLYYGSVTDTLVFAEGAVGKRYALPANLERSVEEVIEFDVLARESLGHFVAFQDDLLTVVGDRELCTDVALLAVAQDIAQPARRNIELSMQVLRLGCPNGEALIEPLHE